MELVFVFSVVLFQILLIHFLQVVEIVRAFGIYAFVQDKVFALFLCGKSLPAMGTAQSELPGKAVFFR